MSVQNNEVSRRHVYINFCENNRMQEILHLTKYRHSNWELSTVLLEAAGLNTRRVIFINIPPEVPYGANTGGLVQIRIGQGGAGRNLVAGIPLSSGK
jgi:hypothetical protein